MAMKSRGKTKPTVRAAASDVEVAAVKQLFSGGSGGWATRQLQAAFRAGKAINGAVLRTLDTLRHEDWKAFDQVVIEEALIRLVGVSDLVSRGLTTPVPNALGKTVFGYERVTDMDPANISLDGLSQTGNDVAEFDLNQVPLPIFHKDWFLNLRTLEASRQGGFPLDTTRARVAARVVAERMEKVLFQGGPTFGQFKTYGYTTHPDRNVITGFTDTKDWDDTTKTGVSFLTDVIAMKNAMVGDRMYGPYMIYVPGNAGVTLDNDFKANGDLTIRERLLQVEGILGIRVADQMVANEVVMVQMTPDVTNWLRGEDIQNVQWDEYGGFKINFKAWAIGAPLIRSDIQGRSGIVHLHA